MSLVPADSYVFDLDGTLVDTVADLAHVGSATLARFGRGPVHRDQAVAFIGEGAAMFLSRCFAATGPALSPEELREAVAVFIELYNAEPSRHAVPFPGVPEVLAALAQLGRPMAICTNKPERPARALLEHLGLAHYFRQVIGGDTLPVCKPDPAPVLAALEALGTVERPWYVGDSPTDRAAARAAGLPCVLVRWGYTRIPVDELGAERVIDTLEGLL